MDDLGLTEFQCAVEPKWWVQMFGFAIYLLVERWIGRTTLFKAASTWDLAINAFKTLFKFIKGYIYDRATRRTNPPAS